MQRTGITAAGSWIVDHVKVVDRWPAQGMLANILSESAGTGGAPYNVLVDLALLGVGIPLAGVGRIGRDDDGRAIRARCESLRIDASRLKEDPEARTSYTDVMTEKGSCQRTFFHCRGANARFAPADADAGALPGKILHLGYLLLLDGMDAADPEYGTSAARWLAQAQAGGLKTAIDVVSEDSDRFERVVTPALKHADYAILNEIEAGRTTGHAIRRGGGGDAFDPAALEASARALLAKGVRETVVVHLPEGALWLSRGAKTLGGPPVWEPSLLLPPGHIQGTAGAGDAFCAGVLLGLHEGWEPKRTLRFAHAMAALCLAHPTCTGGMGPIDRVEALLRERSAAGVA